LAGELKSRLDNLTRQPTPGSDTKEIADKFDAGQEAEKIASLLKQVRGALAFVIGPMADMVFDESVALWTQKNPASTSRLPDLIEMLASEIGSDSAVEFREKINVFLAK
jgi:hypothetical protein